MWQNALCLCCALVFSVNVYFCYIVAFLYWCLDNSGAMQRCASPLGLLQCGLAL